MKIHLLFAAAIVGLGGITLSAPVQALPCLDGIADECPPPPPAPPCWPDVGQGYPCSASLPASSELVPLVTTYIPDPSAPVPGTADSLPASLGNTHVWGTNLSPGLSLGGFAP